MGNTMIDMEHIRRLVIGVASRFDIPEEKKALVKLLQDLAASSDKKLVDEALLECLNDPDFKVQCEAIGLLVRIDQAKYLPIILTKLESKYEEVRTCICGLIAMDLKRDPRAVEPLMKVLRTDPDGTVRWWAAYALGLIGDERALPALEWARDHDQGVDYEGSRVSDNAAHSIKMIEGTAD